jgi:HD-GYP domain-containing protein (c-di-GMP phosphodiesterase class II)
LRAELLGTRFRRVEDSFLAHAKVSATLAQELGLGEMVVRSLGQAFARWDGKGLPRGVGGEQLALPIRIGTLIDAAEVLGRERGAEASSSLIRSVSGRWFEPRLVDDWERAAADCTPAADADLWNVVIEMEPAGRGPLSEDEFDRALELVADYADLKSPWFAGHSRGVAELVAGAARHTGLAEEDVRTARRAALVHDIGRNGVPNSIWDRPGPLSAAEIERVRLHAYFTDRVLRRSRGLARLAAIASSAHERSDGSGYPRAIGGTTVPLLGRYLEAADAYHAMREDRPHRPALARTEAAAELRSGVRAGAFDATAVAAVLAAAGHVARRRPETPAGLSTRELDVLVLVARGLTNRQISARLGITPKTVGNYVERIYAKADIGCRAEAALFAMRNGILPDADM